MKNKCREQQTYSSEIHERKILMTIRINDNTVLILAAPARGSHGAGVAIDES